MSVAKFWHRLFLIERPSISLSFFRIAVAMTTGLHVIPTIVTLQDNYLGEAFKTVNPMFFTEGVLRLVGAAPDGVVIAVAWMFCITFITFLIGLYSQISCIFMTLCCYFFYARNDFHIGTLSWDILLVTLFLMCITSYHGDYFSLDALRKGDTDAYKRPRPYFIQRLLQLQIASTFFYTALAKITAQGNWITGNPMFMLMNYPPQGVTKFFMLKEWLATRPQVCYVLGLAIVIMEITLPFFLFNRKTRRAAIVNGFLFHILLILTLDVPAIFFFLFPAQLLLFINPDDVITWIDRKRARAYKVIVIFDGNCGFCLRSIQRLKVMDLWGKLEYVPFTGELDEVKLEEDGRVFGGFDAFRRLCWILPMLYPMLLVVYLPGAAWIGEACYRFIARNRTRLACKLKST